MIGLEQVSFARGDVTVLRDISLKVKQGELFGIIGPNGSGKSTLLSLIAGTERPSGGSLTVSGRLVSSYSRKELARLMAVLQQEAVPPIGFTVREVVEMGRYPYQNWFGDERQDSVPLIDSIMDTLDLKRLADRTIEQLSGGERQRVALGKTMAQQPRLLLLDEPTTYLDIGYQVQMMDYIRSWQQRDELTIVAVLHDLNLAALYCDRLAVLCDGQIYGVGTPSELLSPSLVEAVYGTTPEVVVHPTEGVPQLLLQPAERRNGAADVAGKLDAAWMRATPAVSTHEEGELAVGNASAGGAFMKGERL
jgi:iron complex transport system ATP-binding protein